MTLICHGVPCVLRYVHSDNGDRFELMHSQSLVLSSVINSTYLPRVNLWPRNWSQPSGPCENWINDLELISTVFSWAEITKHWLSSWRHRLKMTRLSEEQSIFVPLVNLFIKGLQGGKTAVTVIINQIKVDCRSFLHFISQ